MKELVAIRARLERDRISNKERSMDYAVKELLMKQADEALLPYVLEMERVGYRVLARICSVRKLPDVDRSPKSCMAVYRTKRYRLDKPD